MTLLSSCMFHETFEKADGPGLGPVLPWYQADFATEFEWETSGNEAVFESVGPEELGPEGEVKYEDLQLLFGPTSDVEDQRVEVEVDELSYVGTETPYYWTAVALGARLTLTESDTDYEGYIVELARTNHDFGYGVWVDRVVMILYRADGRHAETPLAHATVWTECAPEQDAGDEECDPPFPGTLELEVEGSSIEASFAGTTLTATDSTFAEGTPGLYAFIVSLAEGGVNRVVVDDFKAENLDD